MSDSVLLNCTRVDCTSADINAVFNTFVEVSFQIL
jgi:hypothetical protein